MSFELVDIFPNASHGLANIGFLFGAGSSLKAGYPLMPELTVKVIEKLDREEVEILDGLVYKSFNKHIDKASGDPNIEIISDLLETALFTVEKTNSQYTEMLNVRSSIREKIVEVLLSTSRPNLDDHIRFFMALNRLLSGRTENVWIFTPNYDLLFELAASIAKVPLFNGFSGTSLRFFNIRNLSLTMGLVNGQRFSPLSQPIFRLIKLHGSLDWWKDKTSIYSIQSPDQISREFERVMVLPRRKKITDTLEAPFGEIFRFSEQIIGTQCKYLVSCGYSYGDDHINNTLLLPKLQQGKVRLTAFVKADTPNLESFKNHVPFSFGTENSLKRAGTLQSGGTELWQFDKFVDLLCRYAGI
ncbi:MAG: SIR2 family protein [Candidatus Methanoperedens sp.]|nr:SIR2 family protein [Candidatus Methanoperedens sp.]